MDLAASNLRISGLWPMPMAAPPTSLMNVLDGWDLPEELEEIAKEMGLDPTEDDFLDLAAGEYDGRDAWEMFNQEMINRGISAWFCIAETPVYEQGRWLSYSWGHYRTQFIVAPTAEECMKLAVEWADSEYEMARKMRRESKETA